MGKKRKRKHWKKEGRKRRNAKEEDLEAGPSTVAGVRRNSNNVSGPEKKPEVINSLHFGLDA